MVNAKRSDRSPAPTTGRPSAIPRRAVDRDHPSPWRARLPFALVVLALAASLAVPLVVNTLSERTRDQIENVAEPARRLVDQIRGTIALEASYLRGFVLEGGEEMLDGFRHTRAFEAQAMAQLPLLLEQLDPDLVDQFDGIQTLAALWHAPQDELITGQRSISEFLAGFAEHQADYTRLIAAIDRLSQAINVEFAERRARNARIQRIGAVLTAVLAVLALIAAVLVWRLGEQQRRRAVEEKAIRESTAAVVAATTIEEVIRRIATNAIEATSADSAFVERMDLRPDELEVVGAAGPHAPPVGARTPFEGSFAERVTRMHAPALIDDISRATRPLPDRLEHRLSGWSAAVVPLINGGTPIGALFLLRRPRRHKFRHDEAARALAFGDLATLAFRKIHMLEESERRRDELEAVTESRSRLMRGFSHDVKNPLGGADGYLQLLEEGIMGELGTRQREAVESARKAIGSALALIEDLLQIARAEAGEIELEMARTDVGEAVRELAGEYGAQAEAEGLSLDLEIDDDLPLIVSDASRIRQILGNLLSNAVKYTDEGGIIVRAELRERGGPAGEGPWIAIDVQDTGRGISENEQRILFQEFRRAESAEEGEGVGLGLAISQGIAEALGGGVTVRSGVGEGSTFTLWLPT